jgi:plastocyanin
MNYYLWYIGIWGVLSLWTVGFIIMFRKRLSCMAGMMGAMALGMVVGLGMGALIAVWMPGQLFQATVLGILVGGIIGSAAGLPISLMAVLDGLLSGIMGGMMGTMLISMIPVSESILTLKILAVLSSGVIFLVLLMLQGEIKPEHLVTRSWLVSNPAPMFIVIIVLLGTIHVSVVPMNPIGSGMYAQHGSHEQPSPNSSIQQKIIIKASEFSFVPSAPNVIAGQPLQITLQNTGTVEHDFEIAGTDIHVHAGPGQTVDQVVTLKQPGTYQAICTLPGHEEAGMVAVVHVRPV